MTIYAKIENNAVIDYPLTEGAVELLLAQVSLPAEPDAFASCVAGLGFVVVHPSPRPTTDHTWNVTEGTPELSGDGWVQTWLVEPATAPEIAERTEAQAAAVKRQRNRLLQESDWTQLPDVEGDKETWAIYRSELRSISSQPGYPWNVEWPVPPSKFPSDPTLGDSFITEDGSEWIYSQPRDSNGKFTQDDPLTPDVVESAYRWIRVQT